ncbi:ribosomal large subunit pseudouridine synthase B [Thiosulfatimonas sediminis]|uniref:Pseudouridine synthase n=1 Tax=Thiosulfatimonas sediminis TaxID=2675054 RepID=A0A6F8PUZ1_9GAMM|nr:pseudouridine synthase [Thiosulfatimonas sediminis]BBP45953.1 ribosomal large subunit pseudouridine synthase B [Thiosulfatimonas sediminis]
MKKTTSSPQADTEKLQKILARAGYGSRRSVEKLIEEGLVKVNGRVAILGDRASSNDKIQIRDQLLRPAQLEAQSTQVILYNKPEGRVCTRSDEKGRDTIFTQLPRLHNGRWISIGRLDLNTSGLLILTNNGELANRLMHPSYQIEREYLVRVFGDVTADALAQLREGVMLDDGPAKFDKVNAMPAPLSEEESLNNWYRVVIKEGRNREVRRIWEAVGLQVSRLHRVRYGEFSMPRNLRKGKTQELTWKQINQLLRSVDLAEEARPDLRIPTQIIKSHLAKRDAKKSDRTLVGKYTGKGAQKNTGLGKSSSRQNNEFSRKKGR